MRRVLNPCSACEGSAVPAPCPSPSLSRAHAEQLPSVVRLLLGKGREARQAVQGHRGGTPARCCGGDAPDPGKTEGGEGDIGVPVGWTYGLCGVVVCGFGPRRQQGLSPRAAVSAGGGDPEDVRTEAGLASWAGSRVGCTPWAEGAGAVQPSKARRES